MQKQVNDSRTSVSQMPSSRECFLACHTFKQTEEVDWITQI